MSDDDFINDLCNEDDDTVSCTLCGGRFDPTTHKEGVVIDGNKPKLGEPIPEQIKFCMDCALHVVRSVEQTLRDNDICEHGIICGDWCEPCNFAYKQARIDNGDFD